jgi:hypothetical protein
MARLRSRGAIGVLIAGSMLFSSTAAVAAVQPTSQPDPWAVLSVMSGGASAAAVCGAAIGAAATSVAQTPGGGCVLPQVDQAPAVQGPPPPQPIPPVAPEAAGLGISPLLLGLVAIAAAVGLYLVLHHKHHNNSPA